MISVRMYACKLIIVPLTFLVFCAVMSQLVLPQPVGFSGPSSVNINVNSTYVNPQDFEKIIFPVIVNPKYNISGTEIWRALTHTFPSAEIHILDNNYFYSTKFLIPFMLPVVSVDEYISIRDQWDCDDFAFMFKSNWVRMFGLNAVGYCSGSTVFGFHAWNIIYTDAGFVFFEPQTNDFWLVSNNWFSSYKPTLILF